MSNDYYTYAYLREDGTPYYIGKGCGDRCFFHWGRKISCPPKKRILILKKNLTEAEAFKHEIYMIAVLGRKELGTGILRNFTDGGEGASGRICSETTRAKMSAVQKGKTRSEETRAKMSAAKKGKSPSKEHRAKLSAANKGKPLSEEHRAKISAARKGR